MIVCVRMLLLFVATPGNDVTCCPTMFKLTLIFAVSSRSPFFLVCCFNSMMLFHFTIV